MHLHNLHSYEAVHCFEVWYQALKNNYYWLDSNSKPGFIANGDVIEVLSITSRKNIYGFCTEP